MNLYGSYQVVVVGGGPAGIAAACAAAGRGAKTLLVERYGFLGGMWTAAHVAPFMTTHFRDELVNAGLLTELIRRLKEVNGAIGPLNCPYEGNATSGTGGHLTIYDGEKMRSVLLDMLESAGVELLLHSFFTDSVMSGSKVRGIVVANKSGKEIVLADLVIDATGDADVAHSSGVPCRKGDKDGKTQPMSLMYSVGGVDVPKVAAHVLSHKEDFAWITVPEIKEPIPEGLQQKHIAFSGYYSLVEKGKKSGELHTGRSRLTIFTGILPGQVTMNATRVVNLDGTDAHHLTRAEIDTRKQAISITEYMKRHAPGFESSYLLSTPAQVGVRETRQIEGMVTLQKSDILTGTAFPDAVAKGAFPVDIHQPDGAGNTWEEIQKPYSIPYAAMVPRAVDGLLAAGRCISASHEAMAGLRVTPICFSMGEAAGTAAAHAVRDKVEARNVNVEELRADLKAHGAIV